VLITSRKLRHYFQEYSISIVTDYPLGDILRNQDATGRISKWAVELNIDFKPRTAIKSQELVDFMAEWRENQLPTPTERPEHWVMYFDGSLNLEGAGVGVLLISPMGEQLKYVLQIFWKVSNNEAEYEALLHGLRLAASLGIKWLLVYDDSAVVINQVNKSWDRKKENMDAYCLEVRKLENKFYGLEFHHVVRDNNVAADVLSKLGSTRAQVPAGVFVHERVSSSTNVLPRTKNKASAFVNSFSFSFLEFFAKIYWANSFPWAKEEKIGRCAKNPDRSGPRGRVGRPAQRVPAADDAEFCPNCSFLTSLFG
jgi:ribonuclease HI